MKTSLGFFEFLYPNSGLKQVKELISVEDFKCYLDLKKQKENLETRVKTKKPDPTHVSTLKSINEQLKEYSFPFIVEGSPMHEAIETGIIELPEDQGGNHTVKVKKVSRPNNSFSE